MSALTKVNVFSRFEDQAHNSLLVRPRDLSPRYLEFVSDGTGVFDLFIDCPESVILAQWKPHDRPRGYWIQEVDALRPDLYTTLRNLVAQTDILKNTSLTIYLHKILTCVWLMTGSDFYLEWGHVLKFHLFIRNQNYAR